MSHLSDIKLDDRNLPSPTPEIEQERKVAIFDLLENNTFKLPEKANKGVIKGPFNLNLAIKNKPKAKIINKIKLVVICQNKTNILIFVFPQFLFHEQAPHFQKTETINNLL